MSRTIDERVVSMQFDNRNFENNVKTSMGTIERLKQSLNFKDTSKSLDAVSTAAKRVNMIPLANGVEQVRLKFSALEVFAVTALTNLSNKAYQVGANIVKALTIDPVKTGFQEYETQINAVQTILSNTQSKGSTLEDVNRILDELNEYADQTIYNFTEMTRNIGTFTAAGVELETSATAIKGIANLAAMSGSTSQQASTAMYQLSQALASGTVKLMDWNSVVNAGMGGQVFQDALKQTARNHGIAIDAMIEKNGSFRDSLHEEWLTAEILTETLSHFTMSAEKGSEEWNKLKQSLMDKGYTAAQAEEILELGNNATDAATKVKTFTQMWEVLKESAQSGWAQTWRIIFGDFEEARSLFTPLTNFFTKIIDTMSDARNNLARMIFESPVGGLIDTLEGITTTAKSAVDTITDLGDVVDRVIRGDFGNQGDEGNANYRRDRLTEAGYNYAQVQNLVNEKLGSSVRLTEELAEGQEEVNKTQAENLERLAKMSPAYLRQIGLTEEQITALKKLREISKKTGISIEEILKNPEAVSGRSLLIEAFSNIGHVLKDLGHAAKVTWKEMFEPITPKVANALYDLIIKFRNFTEGLDFTGNVETVEKLRRTFKGLYAALDILLKITAGPFKVAWELFKAILAEMNLDILDVTASIGDALVGVRDWINENIDFAKVAEFLVPYIQKGAEAIRGWRDAVIEWYGANKGKIAKVMETIGGAISAFVGKLREWKNAVLEWYDANRDKIVGVVDAVKNGIQTFVDKISGWYNAHKDLIAGFVNGFKESAGAAISAVIEFAKGIIEAICNVLGIHSPSTEFFDIAKNCIQGFVNGIGENLPKLGEALNNFGGAIVDWIKNIDWAAMFGNIDWADVVKIGIGIGLFKSIKKMLEGISQFMFNTSDIPKSISETIGKLGGMFDSIGDSFKASTLEKRSQAIRNIVISLGILIASLWLLSKIAEGGNLWEAVGALVVISGLLVGLMYAAKKLGSVKFQFTGVFGMAAALFVLVMAMRQLSKINSEDMPGVIAGFTALILGLLILMGGLKMIAADSALEAKKTQSLGKAMFQMAASLLIMAIVIRIISKMDADALKKGLLVMGIMAALCAGLMVISQYSGEHAAKAGAMMLLISVAFLILVGVIKAISKIDNKALIKGIIVMAALELLMAAIIGVSMLAGENATKAGAMMLLMAGAMYIMVKVIKVVAEMSLGDIIKGLAVITYLELLFAGIMIISSMAGTNGVKVGLMLLGMSASLLILAGVIFILSKIETGGLIKALLAITFLEIIFAGLLIVASLADGSSKSILPLTAAIAVLAVAVAGLAMIEPKKLAAGTAALAVALGMLALLMYTTGSLKDVKLGPILAMTLLVAVLGIVLAGMSALDPASTIANAASLSILLLVMSGVLVILSKISSGIGKAMLGVLALALLVIPLVAFVAVLAWMGNIEGAAKNTVLLTGLMVVMTALLFPLMLIGALIYPALLGIAALTLMAVPLLAFVGVLALMQNIQNAEANAKLLITLMESITGMLLKISLVAPLAAIAVVAMGGMVTLMGVVGLMATAIGALMTKFPQLEEFLDKGIPIMEKLAYAIGSFVGNLVAGFAGAIADELPHIGTKLSEFYANASPFIDGMSTIDGGAVLKGVGSLAGAIIALTAADFISSIASFLTGGSSLAELGAQLSMFMVNATPFIMGARMITEDMVSGTNALVKTILLLTAADLLNGIKNFFGLGEEDALAGFGEQLKPFGEALVGYAEVVSQIDEAGLEAMKVSAEAGKTLAEMADKMPNFGGKWAEFWGDNKIDDFGKQLESFGKSIVLYGDSVVDLNAEAVTNSVEAVKGLAEVCDNIPNSGGWAATVLGDNAVDDFGTKLESFGTSLKLYGDSVDGLNTEAIGISVDATKSLNAVADALPNSGGWKATILGDNSIDDFGSRLESYGTSLKAYGDNVDGLNVEAIQTSIKATEDLNKVSQVLPDPTLWEKLTDTSIETFGKKIKKLGGALAGYSEKISGIDISQMGLATNQFQRLIDLVKGAEGVDFDGLTSFSDSLGDIGVEGVKSFIKAFDDAADKVEQAAVRMIKRFKDGMIDSKGDIKKEAGKCCTVAITEMREHYSKFKNVGKYLVQGFAAGITAETWRAEARASAMARAAETAAKNELDINSPSKVFRRIGFSVPEGFAQGIDMMAGMAADSARAMADGTLDTVSGSIARIAEAVNSDIDSQPTIRPVLDLSDVTAGASRIGDLLNVNPSMGVLANVGSIGSMMNRNQNGTNNDVISAIKDLGRRIGESSGDTYSINGVTYDDGSNIKDAVQTIVRAARMERRM